MARSFADWAVEVSSTTGTGAYTLGGAPAGTSYFPLREVFADGDDKLCYYVRNPARTKWEKTRFGTLTYGVSPGTDQLTRNVVASSNGGSAVSWVGGDLPLRIYVAPDSDAAEGGITGWLATTISTLLRFGFGFKQDDPTSGKHSLKLRDGEGSDIQIGVVDTAAHTFRFDEAVAGQTVSMQTGAVITGTTQLPADDSIPQNTEGDEYMSLSITPKSATSRLVIDVVWIGASGAASGQLGVALFQDSTADALAAVSAHINGADRQQNLKFTHVMTSGTTSATTFKVRAGQNTAATTTFNGNSGGRILGGVMASSITIREVM